MCVNIAVLIIINCLPKLLISCRLPIMSFAAKGLQSNWSVKSPTLAVDATPKRWPGRPCKRCTPIFSLDEPTMPGTACVEELADSEVEEAEGSECDIAELVKYQHLKLQQLN